MILLQSRRITPHKKKESIINENKQKKKENTQSTPFVLFQATSQVYDL